MVPQQVPRGGAWMWVTTEGVPGLQQLEDSLKLLPAPRSRVAHPCLALGGSYTAAQESVHLDGAGQEHPAGGERRCGMKESLPAEHHHHPPQHLIMSHPQCSLKPLTQLDTCSALLLHGLGLSSSHCPRFSFSQIFSRKTPSSQTKHCLLTETGPPGHSLPGHLSPLTYCTITGHTQMSIGGPTLPTALSYLTWSP